MTSSLLALLLLLLLLLLPARSSQQEDRIWRALREQAQEQWLGVLQLQQQQEQEQEKEDRLWVLQEVVELPPREVVVFIEPERGQPLEEEQEQRLEQEQGLEQEQRQEQEQELEREPAVSLANTKEEEGREVRAVYLAVVGCLSGILVALVLLLACLCLKQRGGQSKEVCGGQGCRDKRDLLKLQEEGSKERRRIEEQVNKEIFVNKEIYVSTEVLV